MPAVLGADEYRGAVDVWMKKTGRVAPDPQTSEAAEIGHTLEPALIGWAAKELKVRVRSNQLRVHRNGILSATHDALIVGEPAALQVKTTRIVGLRYNDDEWGDPMTDQVPARVLIQCAAEMAVSGLERVYVPALIGGVGRRMYVVERDARMVELVEEWGAWLWDHVERDVMPTGAPKIETLKRLIREPGKTVSIPDDLVLMWTTARNMRLNAEKLEKEAERNLLAALGDAEAGESGVGCVTYLETIRKGYTVGESRYRTLRIKNTKKEIADGGAEGSAGRGQDAGGADGARLAAERPGGGLPSGADVRPVGAGAEGDGAP